MKTIMLISVIALFGLWEVNANTLFSVSSSQWSNSPNGSPCSCGPNMSGDNSNFVDTLIINHEVIIPNLGLNGLIVIAHQGQLVSSGWMQINSSGEIQLENGGVFTSNTSLQLYGTIRGFGTVHLNQPLHVQASGLFTLSGGMVFQHAALNNSGTINSNTDWEVLNVPIFNSGTFQLKGARFHMRGDLNNYSGAILSILSDSIDLGNSNLYFHSQVELGGDHTFLQNGKFFLYNQAQAILRGFTLFEDVQMHVQGSLEVSDSISLVDQEFETAPQSSVHFGGNIQADGNSKIRYKGDLAIDGILYALPGFEIKQEAQGEIIGCGILDFNSAPNQYYSGNYRVNGQNTQLNDITFIGATGNSPCDQMVWYYRGQYSSTSMTCSDTLSVKSDYSRNFSGHIGKLIVGKGVHFKVDNHSTVTICDEIVNGGVITVKSGSTLIVQ